MLSRFSSSALFIVSLSVSVTVFAYAYAFVSVCSYTMRLGKEHEFAIWKRI